MNVAVEPEVTHNQPQAGRTVRPILVEAERLLKSALVSLRPYLESEDVNEIMINAPNSVYVERAGKMDKVDATFTESQIESVLHAIMRMNSKEIAPIMDARLAGLRVAAALPPVAIHGPMVVIRKHASRRFRLDEYVEAGSFDVVGADELREHSGTAAEQAEYEARAAMGGQGLKDFIGWAVRAHKNMLLVGGTGSGKTTFLSSCMLEIPDSERVISCEDTHEIILEQPNIVQLEAMPHEDPAKSITIRQLIRLCLRSRPDRIIVGEIRGPEAYDFLDAMNTGHAGSLCTLHADSARKGLERLESLIRMSPTAANLPLRDMRVQIASAIHYVLFLKRIGGKRGPQEVLALEGVDDTGNYHSRLIFNRVGDLR
jgi:pilus assembly protein CpaF